MPAVEAALIAKIAEFSRDPLSFVRYAYPWGSGELDGSPGPRKWAEDHVFKVIRNHLGNPALRFQPCQIAISSGHGIGKSATVGQLIDWAMSTCVDCKVVLTANTEQQLRTKTWPEVNKWFKLSINAHWWAITKTSITARCRGHEETWRADRVTWSENNTEAFQGLHNQKKRILLILDEASNIADLVWEVSEGALTDEDTEIIVVVLGNPTRTTGRFRQCFGDYSEFWYHAQIDSRTVEGTNKKLFEKWAKMYGEDSDFFRVRVKGEFPRRSWNQLISIEDVKRCQGWKASGYSTHRKVIAVDVARFGDDQTVIVLRQGTYSRILGKYRGLDTIAVAKKVIEFIIAEKPDWIVVDGDGIGAGVVDQLRDRGYKRNLLEFHGGAQANDTRAYFNRRAEVWGAMRDALVVGMQIDDDLELSKHLTVPEYGFSNKNQIQLERKEDMKARGEESPDCGDALAYSFAMPVIGSETDDMSPDDKEAWERANRAA